MRAVWLTLGALTTIVALLASTAALWDGFASTRMPEDTRQRSIPFSDRKIKISSSRGDVHVSIVPGQAGEVFIRGTVRWTRDRPTVSEDWDARTSTLRLDVACPETGRPEDPRCMADYLLSVPPETDIEAGTTRGDLDAGHVFGDVRLTSVSGTVRVNDLAGSLWARVGTGDINAEGLNADKTDVEVGAGDVNLSFVNPPSAVRAVVRTSGDVGVFVNSGSYDLTVAGRNTTVDIDKDPASPRKITAKAPDGYVTLCCR
ncbi:hypothetical protein FE391_04950 [Nonomuraea sp. KC401]|uniref:DUF4097 family beta strand repeat-containing protein n=1 Tax=unclassified Nonomuraea TaxID=2593643 RepID=UPI0010FE001B|nr:MULTISPECIES: DUF4097 family beta strand repeat-containing protein [unclassified Nonomuraea]NBE97149.1 DUF4097 family beta strand repeat protein [Nonomuraea sp. K271]TLF83250.1 hypothetical protein FE391_04950 [Nonomuraea sp. KC401]